MACCSFECVLTFLYAGDNIQYVNEQLVSCIHFFSDRMTGQNYLDFLQNELPKQVEDVPLSTRIAIYFQHDGAPSHYTRHVMQHFSDTFPNRWIDRGSTINWPPRSPDLTPLDFYFWGLMKSEVYRKKWIHETSHGRRGNGNSHHLSSYLPQWLVPWNKAFQRRAPVVIPPLVLVVTDLCGWLTSAFRAGSLAICHWLLQAYFILNASRYRGPWVITLAALESGLCQHLRNSDWQLLETRVEAHLIR